MNVTLEFLRAVVDALLPGLPDTINAEALPPASQLGLDQQLAGHLTSHPNRTHFEQALQAIAREAGSMANFVAADEATAVAILQGVEAAEHEAFLALLFIISADYYENEAVIRAFGWRVTPPQPQGYPLSPFDESLLERMKGRAAIWKSLPK